MVPLSHRDVALASFHTASADGSLVDFWRWAVTHWDVKRVPRVPGVVVETTGSISV